MAIIKVNNTSEESNVNFLTNQSNILHTSNTNKITVNGVNVFIDNPKVGDIMCITRYTDDSGAILPADKQKIKWIDGLSINPKQLSQKYEPVGICVAINGNKAMIRYREEKTFKWAASERWEIPFSPLFVDGNSYTFKISLNGVTHGNEFKYNYNSASPGDTQAVRDFVRQLNNWFLANDSNYSVELVDKDTDLPASSNAGNYRIIVNALFPEGGGWKEFSMWEVTGGTTITTTRAIGKPVKAVSWYYINNGFTRNWEGGCCRAMYYDYIQANQHAPTGEMGNINIVPGGIWSGKCPARLVDFNNNANCQYLRNNFATYDEYLESMLVKLQCGAGGQIAEFPSGKENTYKLANCTFLNNNTGKQEILYKAANWAAYINKKVPQFEWWLPSVAEMSQMMRDVTYDTKYWDNTNIDNNTDIVNRVLHKLTSINNSGWSMLSASTRLWTSSRFDKHSAYYYLGSSGNLYCYNFCYGLPVAPITLYEF